MKKGSDNISIKKVLYISSVDISLNNGPGINETEFINSLKGKYKDKAYFILPKPKYNLSNINTDNIEYTYNFKNNNLFKLLINKFSQIQKARKIFKKNNFDVIVFRASIFPLEQIVIGNYFNSPPYVIKTLGYGVTENAFKQRKNIIYKFLLKLNIFLFNIFLKNAISVDVCTNKLSNLFKNKFDLKDNKIKHIDNSVNIKRFYPINKEKVKKKFNLGEYDPIIGYIGGSPLIRGGREIVEITSRIIDKYPNIGILVVGFKTQNKIKILKEEAKKLGIENRCIFLKKINYDLVNEYINCMDLGIAFIADQEKNNLIGNSSQKVRQYISCGVPVLVPKYGNDFVEDYNLGSKVNIDNLNEIKEEAIKWLSLNEEKKYEFKKNAKEYSIKNLSTENALQIRIDFWEEMINKSKKE